jgi:predicted transcriptional regulator
MTLKQRRVNTGLQVKTILHCLNISRSTYYLMEKGKRKPTTDEKKKLDKLFGGIEDAKTE